METPSATARNVRAICELEEKALARRTISDRIGDVIATQAGRMWFIVFHIIWFAIWLGWNINPHGKHTFDPVSPWWRFGTGTALFGSVPHRLFPVGYPSRPNVTRRRPS
jgi:hypothetical protein